MRAATAKFRSCFYWFPKKSIACGGAQEGLSGRIGVERLLFSGVPALFLPGSAVAAARRTSNSEATVDDGDSDADGVAMVCCITRIPALRS